jgi:hypothetical protein
MSAHTAIRRLLEYTALGIAGVLAALTVGSGLASAAPRMPIATDQHAPAVPFDLGALINAIKDYASVLSVLTGQSTPLGPVGSGTMPGLTDPYPTIPGLL